MRLLLLLIVATTTLAAACPARHEAVDEVPADARRARVAVGETVELDEGRLRVTLVEMERGGTFADVTLAVEADGASVTDEVTVVRQNDYSDPVRVDGWTVRVAGFPGIDSANLVVWRE